jgi:hypothetical protein
MLRRATSIVGKSSPCCTSSAALVSASRGVYSIWGSVVHEHDHDIVKPNDQTPTIQKVLSPIGTRYWRLFTVPAVDLSSVPAGVKLSQPEEYLLSGIEDDIKRIGAVDWTVDFDSFWADRVYSHQALFTALYSTNSTGNSFSKLIFSDCSGNETGREYVASRLALLQATLKWAEETERAFSAIARARFEMQRHVFDALDREKILAGCVVVVDEFKERVPAEFARKATTDLEFHLNTMRHWVWDAPNAKMHFPRQLA